MYKVTISSHAQKQIRKLPKDIQARLAPKLRSIPNHPHLSNLKKLQGSKTAWRLRVGDYRILYEVDDATIEITIYSVTARKEAY